MSVLEADHAPPSSAEVNNVRGRGGSTFHVVLAFLQGRHFVRATDHAQLEECRSQWPRGLRLELSSSAPTLRSWIQIPLEAWMFVCIYSDCFVLCVGSGLTTA
jgi:hypothetical protein